MFVHAALDLIRTCETCINWGVLLKHWSSFFFFLKWFSCQLFHSKAAWRRRLGCYIAQESCPPLLPRESGMLGSRAPSGSPLGDPPAEPGSWSCTEMVSWCSVCCFHRYSPISNTPWSYSHSHLLVLLSVKLHKYGDLGADWQARSRLQCSMDFAGQIKVFGRISLAHGLYFRHSCHRKVLGVVRRTNVSLYFTIWCCNCFVRESRIWKLYKFCLFFFRCNKCLLCLLHWKANPIPPIITIQLVSSPLLPFSKQLNKMRQILQIALIL